MLTETRVALRGHSEARRGVGEHPLEDPIDLADYQNPWFGVREGQVIRPDALLGTYNVVSAARTATGNEGRHVFQRRGASTLSAKRSDVPVSPCRRLPRQRLSGDVAQRLEDPRTRLLVQRGVFGKVEQTRDGREPQ